MSTYTETIWNIIGAIEGLAGIACVTIVLVALFKIIVGDEQDQQKYIKRIKNALIALVLILTCVNIGNTVLNYFTSNDETSTFSIGSIENTDVQLEEVNGGLNGSVQDAYNELQSKSGVLADNLPSGESGLYLINGSWFYCSRYEESDKNIGNMINQFDVARLRWINSLDTDKQYYYSTSTNSYYDASAIPGYGIEHLISNKTGERGMFVFDCGSFGNKIYNRDDLVQAVEYRIYMVTDEETGINYYTSESDSVSSAKGE